jgi:hypothetical protein
LPPNALPAEPGGSFMESGGLTLLGLVFIIRYAQPGPVVDEWEFIPLSDEEPFWPWLWKLHNEHRSAVAL